MFFGEDKMKEDFSIVIGMHRMLNDIDRKTSRIAAQEGLTLPQFGVLEALYSKGRLTIGEVQKAVLSTCGTISVIVNNLAKQELITRVKDPEDGRRTYLDLTPHGRQVMDKLIPQNNAMIEQSFSIYAKQQKKDVKAFLLAYQKENLK
jgi:MarR family 2-MHQ and catechol resistance regulon transcriptional repressor